MSHEPSPATTDPSGDRPDLPAVMTLVADVEGWMSPGQAATLYDSATRCPTGRIDRRDRQLPWPVDHRAGVGGRARTSR